MPQVKQIEGVGKISGSGSKKVIACLLQISKLKQFNFLEVEINDKILLLPAAFIKHVIYKH